MLVNGNESLAHRCAEQFRQSTYCPIRIFHFSYADKAETWNEYVHSFHPGGDYTFFLDGYAAVEPQALLALVHAHRAQPEALAASGIQRYGPSARRVLAWQMARGGLSGNLYMLPYSTISRLRQARFRLPVGIYRTDSTLGAALFIDLDPERAVWNPNRIVTVPQASFTYPIPRFWRWKDLRMFARRRMRQARGLLENRAIRDHFLIRRRPTNGIANDCIRTRRRMDRPQSGGGIPALSALATRLVRLQELESRSCARATAGRARHCPCLKRRRDAAQ